ncbi:MAG: 2Fe-2S iron-sulfur cluster-binding protein [Desulfohalobiaceae bacterium]
MPSISINGQQIQAQEGQSVLQAARAHGINIPALCYHPALSPAGTCRICAVQITGENNIPTVKLACVQHVHEGLEVRTDTDLVHRARTKAFQRLVEMAPESKVIRRMAEECAVELPPAPDECIRCRLCVRACKEIVGAGALKMEKRQGVSYVVPNPEAACIGCATCVNICPTGAIRMQDQDNVRTIYIRDEIIGQNPLQICEACGKPFATSNFLHQVQDRTHAVQHPDIKEHHNYCPTCAKLLSNRVKAASKMVKS